VPGPELGFTLLQLRRKGFSPAIFFFHRLSILLLFGVLTLLIGLLLVLLQASRNELNTIKGSKLKMGKGLITGVLKLRVIILYNKKYANLLITPTGRSVSLRPTVLKRLASDIPTFQLLNTSSPPTGRSVSLRSTALKRLASDIPPFSHPTIQLLNISSPLSILRHEGSILATFASCHGSA
jgi:hypothetical protein